MQSLNLGYFPKGKQKQQPQKSRELNQTTNSSGRSNAPELSNQTESASAERMWLQGLERYNSEVNITRDDMSNIPGHGRSTLDNIARADREASELLRAILSSDRDRRRPAAEATSTQTMDTQRSEVRTQYFDLITQRGTRVYQPFSVDASNALRTEIPSLPRGTEIASDSDNDDDDQRKRRASPIYGDSARDEDQTWAGASRSRGISRGAQVEQVSASRQTGIVREQEKRTNTWALQASSSINNPGRGNNILAEIFLHISQNRTLTPNDLERILLSATPSSSIRENITSQGGANATENKVENEGIVPMDISPTPSLYPVSRKSTSHMSVDDPPLNDMYQGNVFASEGTSVNASFPASARSSRSSMSRNRRAMPVLIDEKGYVLPKKAYETGYVVEDLDTVVDQVVFRNRFLPTFLATISLRRNPLIEDGLEEIMIELWKLFFPRRDWFTWSRFCKYICFERWNRWIMELFDVAKKTIFEYLDKLNAAGSVPKRRRTAFINELLTIVEPILPDPANNVRGRRGRAMRLLWKSFPSEFEYTDYRDQSEWKFKGFFRNACLMEVFASHLRATMGSRTDCAVYVYQILRARGVFPELHKYGGMFEREFIYSPRGALGLTAGTVQQMYSNFLRQPNGSYAEHPDLRNLISANSSLTDNVLYFVDLIDGMSLRQWTLVLIEAEQLNERDGTYEQILSRGLYPGRGQPLDQTQISRLERHQVAQTDEAEDL